MLVRLVSTAACALWAGTALLSAQEVPAVPAEEPPASFTEPQFVDSRGCVFLRAGAEGAVTWVARVTPERKPLCGYPPSLPTPAPEAVAAAQAEPAADPFMEPVAAPAPTPAIRAAAPVRKAKVQRHAAAPRVAAAPPKAPPQVIHATHPDEIEALRLLTIRPGERRSRADLPDKVGCPASAPRARRVAMADGGSTVLCLVPGRGLEGARLPVLPPLHMAFVPPEPAAAPAMSRRFVQIGAFAVPANAERARARLQGLGLPVAGRRAGGLDLVMAGPFTDRDSLRLALTAARSAGYSDAFLR